MSRTLTRVMVLLVFFSFITCSSISAAEPDAASIVAGFQEAGLPVTEFVIFTAENDPNGLLGRPNQYVGKVSFVDLRIGSEIEDPEDIGVSEGGSIEVFANEVDAKARYDYVTSVTKMMPMLAEYGYQVGNVYLRLSKELTPEQAKEYESILMGISLVGMDVSIPQPEHKSQTEFVDAQMVLKALKGDMLPIGDVAVFTAENDPNSLLGRPNQYVSKVSFVDLRIGSETEAPEDIGVSEGGSIEVFANEADAKARYDYVTSVTKMMPMLAEYGYQVGNVYLRLSKELTPEQAREYEISLLKILK